MLKNCYEKAGEIILIPYDRIISNPNRTKKYYDSEDLEELIASICENGLIIPISVKPEENEKYCIISGERRYRASVLAGLTEIPCILVSGDNKNCEIYSLIGDQQQKTTDYFKEARCLKNLTEDQDVSLRELSERLCKSEQYIQSKIKLLLLPEKLQNKIRKAGLREEYAHLFVPLSENEGNILFHNIMENDWSVSQANNYIEQYFHNHRRIMIFKDIRVFTNTVERAIETMQQCGIEAENQKTETESTIEYIVRIIKPDNRA